jgi:molybdopterin converting factor small subunit
LNTEVRYFALFREQTGCASQTVEWSGGTAAELFQLMAEKHAALKKEAAALVAVNDEMTGWETPLKECDVALFFPPVAGG